MQDLATKNPNDPLLTIVFLSFWSAMTLVGYWGNWPPDLSGFYMAGHMFATGQYEQVFAAPELFFGLRVESWVAEFAKLGFTDDISFFPYVYPPIWAALVAPLTQMLTPHAFFNLIYVINIAMLAGCILLAYRILKPPLRLPLFAALMCLLLTFTMISSTALAHNQIQIMVTFCILLAFERYTAGKMIQAGLILSIAAAVKITPALLGLIFLLDREYRAVLAAIVGGLAIVALSFLSTGAELHWTFLERVQTINEQVAVMRVNYNLENLLYHLSHLVNGTTPPSVEGMENFSTPEPFWISITTKIAMLIGTAYVLWVTSTYDRTSKRAVRLFGILTITTLTAPLGWNHHFLPTLFLVPILLNVFPLNRATILMVLFCALNSVLLFAQLTRINEIFHWQALVGITSIIILFLLVTLNRPLPRIQPSNSLE